MQCPDRSRCDLCLIRSTRSSRSAQICWSWHVRVAPVIACHDACRPFILGGYWLRSGSNFVRGDPRSWLIEAETESGVWVEVHRVTNFNFADRLAPALFYTLDNNVAAARCVVHQGAGAPGLATVCEQSNDKKEATAHIACRTCQLVVA